jgi:DNA-directed RNA polymerase subunit E"
VSRKKEKACRECHSITTEDECQVCHSNDVSTDYLGYVIVMDPETSIIARKMQIDRAGKYALKVR